MSSFRKSTRAIQLMNSELQQAQLELLSAHCAVHQLRLHYSTDDLVLFGRREVLRKSAEAATALHDFYAHIQTRIPLCEVPANTEPSPEQVGQAIEWLSNYMRQQRDTICRSPAFSARNTRPCFALIFRMTFWSRFAFSNCGAPASRPQSSSPRSGPPVSNHPRSATWIRSHLGM
jgi:hypothetical protein